MPRLLRVVAALTCLLLVSGLGVGVSAPASATIDTLCLGYDACRDAGHPNAGYQAHNATMYWRMFAGHNCTNYAAYRMVRSGLPNVRPWDGPGNAAYWGLYKPGITDSTPRVGAVAWWKANVPGAGSSGHVAYVEKVVSADEIVVSQDSWGGTFSWATITRDGKGGWPSGFVHFNDVRLQSTAPPAVTGTPRVGEVLTASTGAWKPGADATYAYQWLADGTAIADATGATLTLRPAQEDAQVSVRVRASRLGYLAGSAVSASTPAVQPGELTDGAPPVIRGEATVDATLTASAGTWSPAPTGLAYQWRADGVPIDGATTPTLTPGPEEVGSRLTVTVTASRGGYPDTASTSAPTEPVTPGTLTLSGPPAVTGVPRPGETLRVDPGAFTPADATASVQWRRAGVPLAGATGTTYPLSTDDLGVRISARVTLTRPGYTTLSARSAPTRRVKAAPDLRVRTEPGASRLRLTARVVAAGVTPVPGTVRIRSGGRLLREVTLREGTAAATLRGLSRGRRSFRVRYTGSRRVAAAAVTRTVRIG